MTTTAAIIFTIACVILALASFYFAQRRISRERSERLRRRIEHEQNEEQKRIARRQHAPSSQAAHFAHH